MDHSELKGVFCRPPLEHALVPFWVSAENCRNSSLYEGGKHMEYSLNLEHRKSIGIKSRTCRASYFAFVIFAYKRSRSRCSKGVL